MDPQRFTDLQGIHESISEITYNLSTRYFQDHEMMKSQLYRMNLALRALAPFSGRLESEVVDCIHDKASKILSMCTDSRLDTLSNTPRTFPPAAHRRGSTKVLKKWYTSHADYPYPTEIEKDTLRKHSRLDARQLNMWFINARRRSKNGQKFIAEGISEALHAVVAE